MSWCKWDASGCTAGWVTGWDKGDESCDTLGLCAGTGILCSLPQCSGSEQQTLYDMESIFHTISGSFVEFHAGNPLGNSVFAQISVNNAQAQLEDHETGERLQVHCTAVKRHPLENKFPWKCSNQTVWNPINWIKSCGCLMQKTFFCNSCCRHPRQTQPRGGWEGETSPHQPPQQVRSCNLEVKSLKILFSQSFPSLSSTTGSK